MKLISKSIALALMTGTLFATEPVSTIATAKEDQVVITTIVDNYVLDAALKMRWGLAVSVVSPTASVLFDTGPDGDALLANMRVLGIEPSQFSKVVISHDDDDHTVGLEAFLRVSPNTEVLLARNARSGATIATAAGVRFSSVTEPTEVAPGMRTTGPIDEVSQQEQALIIDTADGLIVITGCAHPGIVPILEKVQSLNPGKPLALVMGGFHLFQAPDTRVDKVVNAFQRLSVRKVAPSHCSGNYARKRFKETYGADYIESGAGLVLKYPVSN